MIYLFAKGVKLVQVEWIKLRRGAKRLGVGGNLARYRLKPLLQQKVLILE